MARASKILTSRIRLAVIGILLLGSAGGVWAATGGPPQLRQAANTLTNTGADATSTPSGQEPTVTPSDDSSQTSANGSPTPTSHGTPTPKPRSTPTSTPGSGGGQAVHWHTAVVSVGTNSFVLRVGGVNYTVLVNGATTWPGPVNAISGLHAGYDAEVLAIHQSGVTYLASTVNAQAPGDD